ncbi:hypothetical protein [Janthinobacterium rivuli]|uniref:hypothetical protein n=1 Tax=Janthinobacterium rivuli TaxID=2751478 RepID=UPI00383B6FA8
MKLALLFLPTFLLTACASIDNAAEAAKLEAAGQTYRQCLAGRILSKQVDVDLYCRSARIGLFQTVMADPRQYEKSPFFDAYAKNIIEMVREDVELAKDVVSDKSTR